MRGRPAKPGTALVERRHQPRLVIGGPCSQETPEAALPLLDLGHHARILERRLDLLPIPHDPLIRDQIAHHLVTEKGKLRRVKALKGGFEAIPLGLNDLPVEPGIEHASGHGRQETIRRHLGQVLHGMRTLRLRQHGLAATMMLPGTFNHLVERAHGQQSFRARFRRPWHNRPRSSCVDCRNARDP